MKNEFTGTGGTLRPILGVVLTLLLVPFAAEAKTLYVDGTNGNDSTSYAANSASSPWRTIGRAAWGSTNRSSPNANEAARAGDVVLIAAGTYTTTAGADRWGVAYNPVNSGTSTAPIRFEAVGQVILTLSSGAGPTIGANARNYIQWSGFTISESTAPSRADTGPVVFFDAIGGSLENSTVTGNPNWTVRTGDNYPGIRIHAARGQRIANNRITGFGGQTGDENHTGLQTYWAADITIENNEFDNCGSGMYLKGNNLSSPTIGWFTIRYNIFRNNTEGIRVLLIPSTASQPNLIHQNVFRDNNVGLQITGFDGGTSDPRHVKALNNVFWNNGAGIFLHGASVPNAGHMFWNNIVSGGTYSVNTTAAAQDITLDRVNFEHNVYTGSSSFAIVQSTRHTLPTWKSTFRQDSATPASIQADPMFMNGAGGDFRLRSGSPAASIGRATHGVGGSNGAVIPAGVYITGNEIIGRTGGSSAPTAPAPSAPTNVRIVR